MCLFFDIRLMVRPADPKQSVTMELEVQDFSHALQVRKRSRVQLLLLRPWLCLSLLLPHPWMRWVILLRPWLCRWLRLLHPSWPYHLLFYAHGCTAVGQFLDCGTGRPSSVLAAWSIVSCPGLTQDPWIRLAGRACSRPGPKRLHNSTSHGNTIPGYCSFSILSCCRSGACTLCRTP